MTLFETLFAEAGKKFGRFLDKGLEATVVERIDTALAEKLSDVRLENSTTKEVETKVEVQPIDVKVEAQPIEVKAEAQPIEVKAEQTKGQQKPKVVRGICLSHKAGEMLKKVGVLRPLQTYSSLNFYFSLREGNREPKKIVDRDEAFLLKLEGHIHQVSKFGMRHIALWNAISSHYESKRLKALIYSRSQAEGLVGYLYLKKGVPLEAAFAYIDESYTKEKGYVNACSVIEEVIAERSKGRPRKSATPTAGERMINFCQ